MIEEFVPQHLTRSYEHTRHVIVWLMILIPACLVIASLALSRARWTKLHRAVTALAGCTIMCFAGIVAIFDFTLNPLLRIGLGLVAMLGLYCFGWAIEEPSD